MTETLVKKSRILDAERISRMIDRMAHEIAEHPKDLPELAFVGIRTRGVPLATRLAARLSDLVGQPFPVGVLDITAVDTFLPLGPATAHVLVGEPDIERAARALLSA